MIFPYFDLDQYLESNSWDGKVRTYGQFYIFVTEENLSSYEQKVKEAREKLGWAKEGEEIWVLPPIAVNPPEEVEEEIPIWREWLEVFSN